MGLELDSSSTKRLFYNLIMENCQSKYPDIPLPASFNKISDFVRKNRHFLNIKKNMKDSFELYNPIVRYFNMIFISLSLTYNKSQVLNEFEIT